MTTTGTSGRLATTRSQSARPSMPRVEVGEDEVDLGGVERRERGLARGVRLDLEAAGTESRGDRLAHLPLVVDDEDASAHHSASHLEVHDAASAGSAGRGRKIEKRLPFPTSLSTSIQPPCSATIPCATASPRPVPSPIPLVVKNGSKTLARSSRAMPRPSSSTVTQR